MHGPWDRAFFESFLATRHLHLDEQLHGLKTPSLVVTGEHDRAVKPAESHRLASELPGAALESIPDCGHLPQEEAPDAFIAAVTPFLGRFGLAY
jgi:pimeloyl-ACP methyl ester carboxylesterase